MNDQKGFDTKMEILANSLIDKLIGNGSVDEMVLDAFKVLSGYQASSRKLSKLIVTDEDERGGGGFGAAKKRIEAASVPPSGDKLGGVGATPAAADCEPIN